MAVTGEDGLGELTLTGATLVSKITSEGVREFVWQPEDFGLRRVSVDSLLVDGPEASAPVRSVLAGEPGPSRDIVILNAAAALWTAGISPSADLRPPCRGSDRQRHRPRFARSTRGNDIGVAGLTRVLKWRGKNQKSGDFCCRPQQFTFATTIRVSFGLVFAPIWDRLGHLTTASQGPRCADRKDSACRRNGSRTQIHIRLAAGTPYGRRRRLRATIGCGIVLAMVAIVVAVVGLGFRTSRLDLLNPKSGWNQRWLAYLQEFGSEDDAVVVVDGSEQRGDRRGRGLGC